MKVAVAVCAGALAGFSLGFTLHAAFIDLPSAQIASIAANTALAARSTMGPAPCSVDWTRMRAELDRAAADALAKSRAGASTTQPPTDGVRASTTARAPDDGLTETQQRARKEKAQLLDAALLRGRWTEADVSAGRQLLPRLAPDDQRDLMARVAAAINDGRLKLDARRPF